MSTFTGLLTVPDHGAADIIAAIEKSNPTGINQYTKGAAAGPVDMKANETELRATLTSMSTGQKLHVVTGTGGKNKRTYTRTDEGFVLRTASGEPGPDFTVREVAMHLGKLSGSFRPSARIE